MPAQDQGGCLVKMHKVVSEMERMAATAAMVVQAPMPATAARGPKPAKGAKADAAAMPPAADFLSKVEPSRY